MRLNALCLRFYSCATAISLAPWNVPCVLFRGVGGSVWFRSAQRSAVPLLARCACMHCRL